MSEKNDIVVNDNEPQAKKVDYAQYSPLALAWLGDSVYELMIRSRIAREGNRQAAKMNDSKIKLVNAKTQAKMIELLKPDLTSEEASIYRRGKNSKPYGNAKNASRGDYMKATGFEALLGWLYLEGQQERLQELVELALERVKETKK